MVILGFSENFTTREAAGVLTFALGKRTGNFVSFSNFIFLEYFARSNPDKTVEVGIVYYQLKNGLKILKSLSTISEFKGFNKWESVEKAVSLPVTFQETSSGFFKNNESQMTFSIAL